MDINYYSLALIKSRKFFKSECRKYVDNSYSLEDMSGALAPDVLYQVLKAARKSRRLRTLLPELLWYADANSMTDANFELILALPKLCRNNCIGTLGHQSLAFYQMQILNTYPQSYEAFSWLFDRICGFECFTEKDMLRLLERNCDTTIEGVEYCINYAADKYGESEKLKTAIEWVAKRKNK